MRGARATANVIDTNKPENIISGQIVDRAIYIHRKLGPGLLENAYEEALCHFLLQDGLKIERQKPIPIQIDNHTIQTGFRADLIVQDKVICELKSIERLAPIHESQLMTYMRLSNIKIGLLINFNNRLLKDGIKRMVI